jgi:hypothetical protein
MIQDGISFLEGKLDRLKEKMNSAIHGVRRIAHEFNTDMLVIGRIINIGKSRVHEILASAKIYKQNNGEIGYIFVLLDMHSDAFVELTGYI